jgi:hypothetical protein
MIRRLVVTAILTPLAGTLMLGERPGGTANMDLVSET